MTALNIVGGHVALNLVNTVEPRVPGGTEHHDHLRTPEDLLRWARQVELVDAAEAEAVRAAWTKSPDAGAQALRATLAIREATFEVLLAALGSQIQVVPLAGLEVLSLRWSAAVARTSLILSVRHTGLVALDVGTTTALLVADRLAHAAVELLRTVDARQLRVCPLGEGGCGWIFLDRSRNGSRRWCAMQDCGARAKARRLTVRRRATRSGQGAQGTGVRS
jgi:predicted RNA-binding Zn ribbon-like protein